LTRVLSLLLVAVTVAASPAAAIAAGCARTSIADLEDEVMCSVCGTTIGLARQAPQAQRERAFIGRLIASCRSKEEIKAALVGEFGPAVLAEPSTRGFSASAYAVPLVAGLLVAMGVVLSLLRWRRATGPGDGPPALGAPPPLPVGDARRLEAELDRIR
jgi:cytochrome c-type biogenesis protein CcmH